MWWARSEAPAQAWLGAGRVAWQSPGGDLRIERVASEADGVKQLASMASASNGRSIRIWLGGDLSRLGCVPAIGGTTGARDAQAAVEAYARAQGQLDDGWSIHVAETAGSSALWRVSVVKARLIDMLVASLGRPVVSVRPWWSWALQQRPVEIGNGPMCAYDGASLTVCTWDEAGNVQSADTVAPIDDLHAVRRLILRRGLSGESGQQTAFARIDWDDNASGRDADFALAAKVRWTDAL